MLEQHTVILAKIEGTYGSDPTPVEADNAIKAYETSIQVVADMKTRNPGNNDLTPFPEIRGKTYVEVKFFTYVHLSGTAGTAPRLSPLFQACGLSETIVSATSVTYAPETPADGVTLYVYKDGIRHIVTGCVGNYDFDFTAGELGRINWTFKGIYQIATDQAIADPTFDTPDPVICKGTTMTFGSYAPIITKLTINANNVIAERPDFNQTEGLKGFIITGRNYDGVMTVEAVLRAETNADFFSYFHSGTVKALSMVLGDDAGNILTLTGSYGYLRAPAYINAEGLVKFELPFQLSRNAGNDEISIALT